MKCLILLGTIAVGLTQAKHSIDNPELGPFPLPDRIPRPHIRQVNSTLGDPAEYSARCNYWERDGHAAKGILTSKVSVAPWPGNCKKWVLTQRGKADCFDEYEISRDGKSVDSCKLNDNCDISRMTQGECKEYYDDDFAATETIKGVNVKLRYPDTGKQCFFEESLYPLLPWRNVQHGCRVWQAADPCNTYEVHYSGRWIVSCDISMYKGVCLLPPVSSGPVGEGTADATYKYTPLKDVRYPTSTSPFQPGICLEQCPEGGCQDLNKEEFGMKLKLALASAMVVLGNMYL